MKKNKNTECSRKKSGHMKHAAAALMAAVMVLSMAGCIDQSQGQKSSNESAAAAESVISDNETDDDGQSDKSTASDNRTSDDATDAKTLLEINDPKEKAAVEAAKKKVAAMNDTPRIIATSPATADICDKLELDLVGVCSSTVSTIPDRYKDVETVGTAMSPDMEIVASLKPDWILSPVSLKSDLQPKYEAIDTDWAFLNLRSVPGMYRSIQELGEIFDRQEQAQKLVDEFTEFYNEYKQKNEGKDHPKVMILMGLPGSYIIATPNSYVGSLVELAGGENVYSDTDQEFLTVNTEDMKTKEPDIILRAAHALPDQVVEMFNKDFAENDIWQHFDAVKNGRVYDLTYEYFGMSATFKYPQALEELQPILYPESDADTQKAKENSDKAQKDAKDSGASEKYDEIQKSK
ncbi:heme ABC transporter, heme-binding protein isdE [Coprococcus catus GD/7]|uniref:High-affinity heme uptake system protein IsdE n=1 Tax=Coprococcus catus GD/7 TaxID=717962 RepID=D4JAX8_9FIRM|nr:heme ABC transporter substrate-binding protein IsdE [Coprococcus catus]CBK81499.1 heme ABC transporter, heme-binding protein isdE [Coprococcus catus GD/7]